MKLIEENEDYICSSGIKKIRLDGSGPVWKTPLLETNRQNL